jgi:hypothetical protein
MLEAVKTDPSVSGLIVLAVCYETLGKTASASARLHEAELLAASKGDPRIKEVRGRIALLDPRVPKLTLVVSGDADIGGLTIKQDGEVLPRDRWGQTGPIDPGEHVFEITAPERKRRVEKLIVTPGQQATVKVRPLDVENAPAAAAARPKGIASPTHRTVGLVVAGVGLVSIAFGSVFGVLAIDKHGDVKDKCPTFPTCPESQRSALENVSATAQQYGTLSTITFLAGGALVAGGALIYLTAPTIAPSGKSARVTPFVGAGAGGLALSGAW